MKQTLILSPRYSEDSIIIRKAALSIGWDVQRLSSWRVPDYLKTSDREFILYGEPLFVIAVADQLNIKLQEPSFNWLTTVPEEYVKRKITYTTLGQARKLTKPYFIKPPGDKVFQAKVYSSGMELPSYIDDTEPALISEPVEWEVEVRTFILNRNVMTLSPYLRNSKLAREESGNWPFYNTEKEEAIEFAQEVIKDIRLQIPYEIVLDVGKIKDIGWAVIEINLPCCSGIYGCVPGEVLKVLQRSFRGGKN